MIGTPILPALVITSPMERTSKKRTRKAVSFFPKVTVKYCHHYNEYTPEERRNTWLTKDELKAIRSSSSKIAREFSMPGAPTDGVSKSGDCLRGLEGKTAKGIAKRKRIKAVARNAVFEEQNMQICIGIVDAEAIADVYYEHTEYAQIDAHMRGLRDQVDALVPSSSSPKETSAVVSTTTKSTAAQVTAASTTRKSLFLAGTRGNSAKSLLTSTSSRRLLTDKFFNV